MRLRAWLGLLRPHLAPLAISGVLLAPAAAAPAAAVWLLKTGLEALDDPAGVGLTSAAFVALYTLQAAAQVGRTALTKQVSGRMASELRRRLHAAFLDLPAEGALGDRLSALTDEVDQVQYGVSALVTAVRNPLTVLALLVTAGSLAPGLALPAVVLLAPTVVIGIVAGRWVRLAAHDARTRRAALSALGAEQLGSIDVLRAFDAEPGERGRFAVLDAADRAARWRLEVARVLPSAAVELAAAVALGGLLWIGARQVAAGSLDPPSLVAFVVALLLVNRPLSGLAEVWSLLQRSLAALDRVERALAAVRPPPAGDPVPDGPLTLRWDRVSVRIGRPIVEDVTFEARPGELVALVGPTGAGKTTLLRLAVGVLVPDAGQVTIGGLDVGTIDRTALRRTIALVPQDPVLLARSVAENVALGAELADPARVERALTLAGAGFVLGWPGGIDTTLDEAGRGLSGGERQRLCLARALYRDARVLVLDEPTAQLDAATARALADTLTELRPGRVIVVATHDPEVWGQADRVVTIGDGRLEG